MLSVKAAMLCSLSVVSIELGSLLSSDLGYYRNDQDGACFAALCLNESNQCPHNNLRFNTIPTVTSTYAWLAIEDSHNR